MGSNIHDYDISDSKNDHGSAESLLREHDEPSLRHKQKSTIFRKTTSSTVLLLHIIAIIFYGSIALLITYYMNWRATHGQPLIYSPANEVLEYQPQLYQAGLLGDDDYFGEPSDYVDKNWHELLLPSSIHVTEAERQHFSHDLPIVQFPDGSYLGSLWVYHELHCLKRIYQYLHKDYYFQNLSDHQIEMNRRHNDHCLGTLRQAIMCHGDVTVMSLVWGQHSPVPLGDFSNAHQCANFDKLHSWAMERRVSDADQPGILVHPKLDGKGTKIGFEDSDIDGNGNVININSILDENGNVIGISSDHA